MGLTLGEKTLSINISEILYASIAHAVQYLVDENGVVNVSETGLLKNEYRFLNPGTKKVIEGMTVDIINALEQYQGQIQTDASRYRLLPSSIREFIESGPSDMFVLGSKMTEAVKSREVLHRIHRLSLFNIKTESSKCSICFLEKTRKILKESGLTPFCD